MLPALLISFSSTKVLRQMSRHDHPALQVVSPYTNGTQGRRSGGFSLVYSALKIYVILLRQTDLNLSCCSLSLSHGWLPPTTTVFLKWTTTAAMGHKVVLLGN